MAKPKSQQSVVENDRTISITSCVICDDIRYEDNAKVLLIGVYSGEIGVDSFPATMPLRVYLGGQIPGGETHEIHTEVAIIDMVSNETVFRLTGRGEVESNAGFLTEGAFPTPPFVANFKGPSFIQVRWKAADSDWKTLVRKRVELSFPE